MSQSTYTLESIDADGMYLVEWPDGSKRLLFGRRIIASPVSTNAVVTRLAKEA